MMKYFYIALALGFAPLMEAEEFCFKHTLGPHRVYLGPEFCHLSREKSGGSKQSGWLYGAHLRYERIRPCSLYWAIDSYIDIGKLHGKTASGNKMKSTFDQYEIQGRIGYSLSFPRWRELLITPYGGYSFYYAKNKFHSPSPVHFQFHDRLQFAAAGLWISLCVSENLRAGVDFTGKYMVVGKNRITHDPENDHISLAIESKWQYEVDIPIDFTLCICERDVEFRFVPFYRLVHLGGKPNYPFDFIETKYKFYGVQAMVNVLF